MSDDDYAFYYPNLSGLNEVKLLGTKILCSDDLGAGSPELRHFIDYDTLMALDSSLLDNIVEPIPPCNRIIGRGMKDQKLVGMLSSQIIIVQNQTSDSTGLTNKVYFILDNVLVINKFPVPLHVSIKRLMIHSPSLYEFSMRRTRFVAPVSFQNHPYWSDETLWVGSSPDFNKRYNYLREYALQSKDTCYSHSCNTCGVTNRQLQRCSRCKMAKYCSKEHQQQDWLIRHRNVCIQDNRK